MWVGAWHLGFIGKGGTPLELGLGTRNGHGRLQSCSRKAGFCFGSFSLYKSNTVMGESCGSHWRGWPRLESVVESEQTPGQGWAEGNGSTVSPW